MARFRKIDVRMWGDARFCSLSQPQPNAQTLWIYLLTGPHTTSIPGLFIGGEAGLAEAIGWSLEGFREAFREVLREGMAEADFKARVVWIPKAILYNAPESPNVVKSWGTYWDEIPECPLKLQAYQQLKAFLKGISEAFEKAFEKSCRKPSGKTMANQEQEQEQEHNLFGGTSPPEKEPDSGLPNSENPASKYPRKPNPLFDAVASVTNSDPKASAAYIGKVCKSLRSAEPPYTPEEVLRLPQVLRAEGFTYSITLGTVEKNIGKVRQSVRSAATVSEDVQRKKLLDEVEKRKQHKAKIETARTRTTTEELHQEGGAGNEREPTLAP